MIRIRSEDDPAIDDDQQPVGTVEFDYDAIDGPGPDQLREDAIADAAETMSRLMVWVWSGTDHFGGFKNTYGPFLRFVVASWFIVPEMRAMNMTQIAERIGKHKQSLGRAAESFKRTFPEIAKHTRHLRT